MCTLHTSVLLPCAISRISTFPHGAWAFSLGEQLPGAGHLPNPISKTGREEQGQRAVRLEQGQRAGEAAANSPQHIGTTWGQRETVASQHSSTGFSTRARKSGLASYPRPFLLPSPSPAPSQPSSACPLGWRSILRAACAGNTHRLQHVAVSRLQSSFPCGLCTAVLRFPLSTFHSRFQAAPVPAWSFVLQAHRRAGACWALQCSGDLSSPAPVGRQPGVSAVFGTSITALQPHEPSSQPHSQGDKRSQPSPVLDTPATLLGSLMRSCMTASTRNSYQVSWNTKHTCQGPHTASSLILPDPPTSPG